MKLVQLTNNLFAKVDDDDFDELSSYKWRAQFDKKLNGYYANRRFQVEGKRVCLSMHRQVMKTPKGIVCDHVDHDTLNNQKSNLRNCTHAQNLRNRKGATRVSKTRVVGVAPHGAGYLAYVTSPDDGKQIGLGTFATIEEARLARSEAEKKYYGEFAFKESENGNVSV